MQPPAYPQSSTDVDRTPGNRRTRLPSMVISTPVHGNGASGSKEDITSRQRSQRLDQATPGGSRERCRRHVQFEIGPSDTVQDIELSEIVLPLILTSVCHSYGLRVSLKEHLQTAFGSPSLAGMLPSTHIHSVDASDTQRPVWRLHPFDHSQKRFWSTFLQAEWLVDLFFPGIYSAALPTCLPFFSHL